jgi:hypothetical protein
MATPLVDFRRPRRLAGEKPVLRPQTAQTDSHQRTLDAVCVFFPAASLIR